MVAKPGEYVSYDEAVSANFNLALGHDLPPEEVFLSNAWKVAIAAIKSDDSKETQVSFLRRDRSARPPISDLLTGDCA